MKKKYPLLDLVLNKIVSRKLTVFIIACFFAAYKIITSQEWTYIALLYISTQTALDGGAYIYRYMQKRKNAKVIDNDDPINGADGPTDL